MGRKAERSVAPVAASSVGRWELLSTDCGWVLVFGWWIDKLRPWIRTHIRSGSRPGHRRGRRSSGRPGIGPDPPGRSTGRRLVMGAASRRDGRTGWRRSPPRWMSWPTWRPSMAGGPPAPTRASRLPPRPAGCATGSTGAWPPPTAASGPPGPCSAAPLAATAAALTAGQLSVAHAAVVAAGTHDLPQHTAARPNRSYWTRLTGWAHPGCGGSWPTSVRPSTRGRRRPPRPAAGAAGAVADRHLRRPARHRRHPGPRSRAAPAGRPRPPHPPPQRPGHPQRQPTPGRRPHRTRPPRPGGRAAAPQWWGPAAAGRAGRPGQPPGPPRDRGRGG
jgi:hypothetical protein